MVSYLEKELTWYAYAHPKGGIGDFCIIEEGNNWHLFHIFREYKKPMNCHDRLQETFIGHASGKKLNNFIPKEHAISARPDKWDSTHVWAPAVVKHKRMWYMFYTGVDSNMGQKIGLVISENLSDWKYPFEDYKRRSKIVPSGGRLKNVPL
jgi:predicted GH43/DUF377 family glycosyl hydrolase